MPDKPAPSTFVVVYPPQVPKIKFRLARHERFAPKALVDSREPREPIINYKGGVFSELDHSNELNHSVSIVGWGYDDSSSTEYWYVIN